jgi:hypothetical protein
VYRTAHDDAGRGRFYLARHGRVNVAEAVDRTTERIDDATDHRRTDRDLQRAAGPPNLRALLELEPVAEDDGADVVLFEVEGEGGDALARLDRADLEHLAGHCLLEAIDTRDPVLDLEHGADLFDVELVKVGSLDFSEEDVFDLAGAQGGFGSHGLVLGVKSE